METQTKTITHGALWATLGNLSQTEAERIWHRLEAGETIVHEGRQSRHLGYEQIEITKQAP